MRSNTQPNYNSWIFSGLLSIIATLLFAIIFDMRSDIKTLLAQSNIDKTEISKIEWKTFNDSISAIRPYNLEKKRIISNINIVLTNCTNTFA